MAEQIIDGTGRGFRVLVDSSNRLHTQAVTETIVESASEDGRAFNINTGTINLTTANESALLYLKNNGDRDIHISSVGYLLGNSTGGSGDVILKVIKNPTAGTVVSDAIATDILENKNVGSSNIITVDAYKGGEGKTLTDGSNFYYSLIAGAARPYVISTGTVVIPKGGSIGVKVTPQTGNTSMNIQIFLSAIEYKEYR